MVKNQKNNKLKIVVFFLITLLFKPLWLFNNNSLGIPGDDMSYWLHSATLAFDQDLEYTNDYEINSNIFNSETNAPSHPPGAGYLASPFVFLLSQLDNFIENSIDNKRTNPLKSFAYLGFFIAGLFYTYLGTLLLSKILKKYNNKYAGLLIFCGLLSTLVHFVSTRFLMAHATEFFLCSVLIYIFEKNKNKRLSITETSSLFLIFFLLAITRPSTFLYSLFLIFFYRKKFNFNIKSNFVYLIQFLVLSSFYVLISNKLYKKNFMLLNTYGENMNEYASTLNFEQLFNGFLKLPNLFFSPNMGIIFSTPIVFLAAIIFFTKQFRNGEKLNTLFIFLFFGASFMPLLIWQGREVAYGQRLLIGIIPFCTLMTCKYLKGNHQIFIAKLLTGVTYLGYLLFYSSEKLTLKPGLTLWGTQVGFTAENYYIEAVKALTDFETIVSALIRNIYVVDFFKFFNLRNFLQDSSLLNYLNLERVDNFLRFTDVYHNLNINYLILVNFSIFIFSYLYTKLIFSIRS